MTPFITLESIAIPIEGQNIDTDQIIPARFLKKNRGEYADFLFYDQRIHHAHQTKPDHVLDQPIFKGAKILVCDENFGCGSSREAAVYAMVDFGIQAILAPSFGDIFFNNCLKNGVLPVVLPQATLNPLRQSLAQTASSVSRLPSLMSDLADLHITIDLVSCTVHCKHFITAQHFDLDPFWQECLVKGVDELSLTLSYSSDIQQFEQFHHKKYPWLASEQTH